MPKPRPDLAARMDLELAAPEPASRTAARPAAPASAPTTETGEGRGPAASRLPPSRQNAKRIQGYFSVRVKRQLRMLSAETDKTEEQLVGEALNMLFQSHGLPTIAFDAKDGG